MAQNSLAFLIRSAIHFLLANPGSISPVTVPLSGRTAKTAVTAALAHHKKNNLVIHLHIWTNAAGSEVLIGDRTEYRLPPGAKFLHTIEPTPFTEATQPEELVYKPVFRPPNGRDAMAFKAAYAILREKAEPLGGSKYLSFILGVSLDTLKSYRQREQFSYVAACKLDNIAGVREMGITLSGLVSRLINIPPIHERAKYTPLLPLTSLRPEIQKLVETTHKPFAHLATTSDVDYLISLNEEASRKLRTKKSPY